MCIEAAGFHYVHSLAHQVEMKLSLETDTPEILNQIITTVRKGGRIAVIGAQPCTHCTHDPQDGAMFMAEVTKLIFKASQRPQSFAHVLAAVLAVVIMVAIIVVSKV